MKGAGPVAPVFSSYWYYNNNYYMKTGRFIKSLLVMLVLSIGTPTFAAVIDTATTPTETPEAKIARLTQRIEEIKAMDKSKLSRGERKELKKEVRQMRDEVKALSGGVYISIGALLVVILLLILLL
jgi:hypothetical protein